MTFKDRRKKPKFQNNGGSMSGTRDSIHCCDKRLVDAGAEEGEAKYRRGREEDINCLG